MGKRLIDRVTATHKKATPGWLLICEIVTQPAKPPTDLVPD